MADAPASLPEPPTAPLDVAVSDCLLGKRVRYDGSHKRTAVLFEELEGLFRLHGICPEVGIGLGVPRPPIQLVGEAAAPRARGVDDPRLDVTEALRNYARDTVPRLAGMAGYVFTDRSPSCGVFHVKVRSEHGGVPRPEGRGIYAAQIMRQLPALPVEEGERLENADTRANFVTRVFVYAHWLELAAAGMTSEGVMAFHERYEHLLMERSAARCRHVLRSLSKTDADLDSFAEEYVRVLMNALTKSIGRDGSVVSDA